MCFTTLHTPPSPHPTCFHTLPIGAHEQMKSISTYLLGVPTPYDWWCSWKCFSLPNLGWTQICAKFQLSTLLMLSETVRTLPYIRIVIKQYILTFKTLNLNWLQLKKISASTGWKILLLYYSSGCMTIWFASPITKYILLFCNLPNVALKCSLL